MSSNSISNIFLSLVTLFSSCFAISGKDTVITGIIKDKSNKNRIAGATISASGTNISTVSNADGSFTIKVPDSLFMNGIKVQQMGFYNTFISHDEILKKRPGVTILLSPATHLLKAVTVYGADPRILIEQALNKIPANYSDNKVMFSSFYRETVQKGKRFIEVSEAFADIFKTSYKNRSVNNDRVMVKKGRKLISQSLKDTLGVKILGGPVIPIMLDFVKNNDALFSQDELDYYEFKMEHSSSIDDRLQYVVSFKPNVKVEYPLYRGKVFIDQETLAFTRAEYSVDTSDKNKVIRSILYRKPRGLHFNPQEIQITANYKFEDGKSFLNYISTRTKFKCDWKRRLFASGYTVNAEAVMVNRDDNPATGISRKDAFGNKDILSENTETFKDKDFWKNYNIIEPTESLEKAVSKLIPDSK